MPSDPAIPPADVLSAGSRSAARWSAACLAAALFLPLLLGFDSLGWFDASHQTAWSLTIDQRTRAHASTIATPKVVFVGGSSVAFGVRPDALSRRLGVPVIVYGLNAGLGLDLIVSHARRIIRPGDVVVLVPELQHFAIRGPIDPALRGDWLGLYGNWVHDRVAEFPGRLWIATKSRSWRIRREAEWWWQGQTRWLLARAMGWQELRGPFTPYALDAIDRRGVLNFRRPRPFPTITRHPPPTGRDAYDFELSTGAIAMRRLAGMCRSRPAALFIMPAMRVPGPADTDGSLAAAIDRERDMLAKAASIGIPALLPAGRTVPDPKFVYDTTYHLNDRGVALMEDRLAAALTPLIKDMPRPRPPPPRISRPEQAPR